MPVEAHAAGAGALQHLLTRGEEHARLVRLPPRACAAPLVAALASDNLTVRRRAAGAVCNASADDDALYLLIELGAAGALARHLLPSAVLHDVSDGDAAAAGALAALAPGARVRVEGLASAAGSQMNGKFGEVVAWRADKERWEVRLDGSADATTVNIKPTNLAPLPAAAAAAAAPPEPAPATDGGAAALKQLAEAEAALKGIASALTDLEEAVRDMTASGGAADADGGFRAAATQLISGHVAAINKLMAGLDELSLGAVEDASACADARARKKAAAALLEGTLLVKARALRSQLEPPPPPPKPPPAAPATQAATQSAEIDSDED